MCVKDTQSKEGGACRLRIRIRKAERAVSRLTSPSSLGSMERVVLGRNEGGMTALVARRRRLGGEIHT